MAYPKIDYIPCSGDEFDCIEDTNDRYKQENVDTAATTSLRWEDDESLLPGDKPISKFAPNG